MIFLRKQPAYKEKEAWEHYATATQTQKPILNKAKETISKAPQIDHSYQPPVWEAYPPHCRLPTHVAEDHKEKRILRLELTEMN